MGLTVSRHADEVTVVHVDGQLVIGNRNELKELLVQRIGAGDRRMVLDFSHSPYIDSSGLGALVTMAKKAREAGGEIRLAGLNSDLRDMFQLTKLDTLFRIADTVEQAVASY